MAGVGANVRHGFGAIAALAMSVPRAFARTDALPSVIGVGRNNQTSYIARLLRRGRQAAWWFMLAAILEGVDIPSAAQSERDSQQANVYETAQVFVQKLQVLLSQHEGYVEAKDLRSIFKRKISARPPDFDGTQFFIKTSNAWRADISLSSNNENYHHLSDGISGRSSVLSIQIPLDMFGNSRAGECLLDRNLDAALQSSGWRLKNSHIWALTLDGVYDHYIRDGDAYLYVWHYALRTDLSKAVRWDDAPLVMPRNVGDVDLSPACVTKLVAIAGFHL